MPLVKESEVQRVTLDGDWYDLRKDLGFYYEHLSNSGDWSIEETKGADELTDDDIIAGEFIARQNVTRLFSRIADWSYEEKITIANVRRIHSDHAEKLLEAIGELEQANEPFPDEREPVTSD